MRDFWGIPHNISRPLLGVISRKVFAFSQWPSFLVTEKSSWTFGHSGVLTTSANISAYQKKKPYITEINPEILSLNDGDIVKVYPDGRIRRVWEKGSHQNVIFVTDKCDCKCIMCPQPSDSEHKTSFWEENRKLLTMVEPETKSICFTGGEPTLEMEQLKDLLALCKKRFRDAHLAILTNGISLASFDKVKQLVEQSNKFLLFCVSLNGDTNDVHDEIVGKKGAFGQVMRGLYNLARFKCHVEIRFVIMRQNYERLPHFAEFVYRNIPFVSHIAFMGLEYTGEAARNLESIKIDPFEYADHLREAVLALHRREMNVSIYNIPKCLLRRDIWRFSRDSISTWKKGFLEICSSCEERANCCGLFVTSEYVSPNISPIITKKSQENCETLDPQVGEFPLPREEILSNLVD